MTDPVKRRVAVPVTIAAVGLIAAVVAHYGTQVPPAPNALPFASAQHSEAAGLVPAAKEPVTTAAPVVAAPSGRVRPSRPPACDDDDLVRAARYSLTPGYAYLAGRCDIIHQWKADPLGGDIIIWLGEHGYDSPAADCDYSVEVMWKPGAPRWPILVLTYHGHEYEQPLDATAEAPQTITFRAPCYAATPAVDGALTTRARTAKCVRVDADPAKSRTWDLPADGKCGEPPPL